MNEFVSWVIHIASFEVVVGGRLLQRCAVCGCLMADSGKTKITVTGTDANGDPTFDPPFVVFGPQSLVAERGRKFIPVVAPDNFYPSTGGCISLVEEGN